MFQVQSRVVSTSWLGQQRRHQFMYRSPIHRTGLEKGNLMHELMVIVEISGVITNKVTGRVHVPPRSIPVRGVAPVQRIQLETCPLLDFMRGYSRVAGAWDPLTVMEAVYSRSFAWA